MTTTLKDLLSWNREDWTTDDEAVRGKRVCCPKWSEGEYVRVESAELTKAGTVRVVGVNNYGHDCNFSHYPGEVEVLDE